ncbi:MAG: PHB depolymerase family esterase [Deltaproteobacteria bacterium]
MKVWITLAVLLAAPSAEAAWSTRTLGGTTVHVYTPATPRGPLMVALHGCAQQATSIRDAGWDEPAEQWGAVVAVPAVPNGGVLAGCWDYYGANHTRTGRHDGPVLQIVAALEADAALGIDPDRVYISGLSSGAGQAMVLGCLAPDVFAGVGINAGPTVGTEASEVAIVSTTVTQGVATCRTLAGSNADAFATQLASIIYGDGDFVVNRSYNALNADVLASLYDAPTEADFDVSALPGHNPTGTGQTWSDAEGPRVSLIEVTGMGHAFPAGTGPGGVIPFVATDGPSWPAYLFDFFGRNDRRSDATPPGRDGGTMAPVDGGPGTDAGTSNGADASVGDDASTPAADGGGGGGGGGANGDDEVSSGCTCTPRGQVGWIAWVVLIAWSLRTRRV